MALADGTRVFVGDQVATRRNDASVVAADGAAVRNRQIWTVRAIGEDGSVTVADRQHGRLRLPKDYVARHVESGWAVTGYGNQGVTVDHGICVVEPASTRAGIYVAMTRGRNRNVAWVLDRTGRGCRGSLRLDDRSSTERPNRPCHAGAALPSRRSDATRGSRQVGAAP